MADEQRVFFNGAFADYDPAKFPEFLHMRLRLVDEDQVIEFIRGAFRKYGSCTIDFKFGKKGLYGQLNTFQPNRDRGGDRDRGSRGDDRVSRGDDRVSHGDDRVSHGDDRGSRGDDRGRAPERGRNMHSEVEDELPF